MSKKLISWNVNGLRSCMGKGFMDFFDSVDADVFCLQEIKLSEIIIHIGIMLRKKVIPVLRFFLRKSHSQ